MQPDDTSDDLSDTVLADTEWADTPLHPTLPGASPTTHVPPTTDRLVMQGHIGPQVAEFIEIDVDDIVVVGNADCVEQPASQ